ncbi:MAG: peptidase S10 [Congregibacter sp.]
MSIAGLNVSSYARFLTPCHRKISALAGSLLVAALTVSSPTIADADADADKEALKSPSSSSTPTPTPKEFSSTQQGSFNGKRLNYTARAGETFLLDRNGEPTASIFSFDYLGRDGGKNRPVTFVWNGGPGSASLWLHMGTFGPKRVVVPSDAKHAGAPPFPIVDAAETILDVTDLVFIDPVGTGYSRALGEHHGKEFWGLNEDAESMAAFIKRWLSQNKRWNSPRFLLGESFGTTRAARVAELLESEYNVALNGLVFISQALDYAGSSPYIPDNLISHVTYVPTMAATAYYHGRVDAGDLTLEEWVQASREFAVERYLPALFKGNTLSEEEFAAVRDELAKFTGLTPDYVEKAGLRVRGNRFAKELLRNEGLTVGMLDARYIGDPVDDLTDRPENDAASNAISGAYYAGLLSYLQSDLGVNWDRDYLSPADPELSEHWNWNPEGREANWEPHWVNTAHSLVAAFETNPNLKVLVASGYYDLVTPFFDAEYTLNRHGIARGRIQYRYYGGGHMMYVNEEARLELLRDVRAFIRDQLD